MSFRKHSNRHDSWIRLCEASAATFADIGLPAVVFQTERNMRAFLTTGHAAEIAFELEAMTEEQFWKLFHFATSTFDYDVADFTALERRRTRGASGEQFS